MSFTLYSGLTCNQLQALIVAGDQNIENLYIASRTNPFDPLSGAPRLTIFALNNPSCIVLTNPLWVNIYAAQLQWKTTKALINRQRALMGCFR